MNRDEFFDYTRCEAGQCAWRDASSGGGSLGESADRSVPTRVRWYEVWTSGRIDARPVRSIVGPKSGGATVRVMETANVRESNHLSALRWFDLAALWTLLV